jgi:hypothetical protein
VPATIEEGDSRSDFGNRPIIHEDSSIETRSAKLRITCAQSRGQRDKRNSYPLIMDLLIGCRAGIDQRPVSSASAPERFVVEEQVRPGFVVRSAQPRIREFAIRRHCEAARRCDVVPANAAVDVGLGSVSPQRGMIGLTSVLPALIRVMDKSTLWLSSLGGLPQGSQRQLPSSCENHWREESPSKARSLRIMRKHRAHEPTALSQSAGGIQGGPKA